MVADVLGQGYLHAIIEQVEKKCYGWQSWHITSS